MPFIQPMFLLSGLLFIILAPVFALFGIAIFHAAKEKPARTTDAKLLVKLKEIELQREEIAAQFEQSQLGANQMVDRIRHLERLLVEERRQRLAESTEILTLREYASRLEQRLRK